MGKERVDNSPKKIVPKPVNNSNSSNITKGDGEKRTGKSFLSNLWSIITAPKRMIGREIEAFSKTDSSKKAEAAVMLAAGSFINAAMLGAGLALILGVGGALGGGLSVIPFMMAAVTLGILVYAVKSSYQEAPVVE